MTTPLKDHEDHLGRDTEHEYRVRIADVNQDRHTAFRGIYVAASTMREAMSLAEEQYPRPHYTILSIDAIR